MQNKKVEERKVMCSHCCSIFYEKDCHKYNMVMGKNPSYMCDDCWKLPQEEVRYTSSEVEEIKKEERRKILETIKNTHKDIIRNNTNYISKEKLLNRLSKLS